MTAPATAHLRRPRHAALAAGGFAGVAAFQLALALGAPLGRAAYGGAHAELPPAFRIASALAAGFWLVAALVILRRGGYRVPVVTERGARIGARGLVALMAVATLMNLASSSPWERYGWAPYSLALAGLTLVVVRAGAVQGGARQLSRQA